MSNEQDTRSILSVAAAYQTMSPIYSFDWQVEALCDFGKRIHPCIDSRVVSGVGIDFNKFL
jgi:hypothetical protein